MSRISLSINGRQVEAIQGCTILEAARAAEIYIPVLCSRPGLPPATESRPLDVVYRGKAAHKHHGQSEGRGCGLCVVEVQGETELKPACSTPAEQGMVVVTDSNEIKAVRSRNLSAILADHPHACLTCAQREGCSRTQCSSNVPENERCCPQLGHCELQAVAEYIGLPGGVPRWTPSNLPILKGPLFTRDYNLCIGCTRCVRACEELRGVSAIGFVMDETGRVVVGTVAESLEESGCRFCTACVEVCPTGALSDNNVRASSRERDIVPCRAACPAGIDIPWQMRLIAEGRFKEALAVVLEKVPFPGILGRICEHPCEEACRRRELNAPLSVRALKRFVFDQGDGTEPETGEKKPAARERIAVVGSGPAGLTCAFYLNRAGFRVDVFDSAGQAGGMLRWGIPEYRLPREILEKEIKSIFDSGIEFIPGNSFGSDLTINGLKEKGYSAVFLGLGAQESKKINLTGSDKDGVLWGMDFLRSVRQGNPPALSGETLVIGGGNAAIDAALTAVRTGAAHVSLVCLESREEMPAHEWECSGAEAEGVDFHNSWGPVEVLGDKNVSGVKFNRCTRVFDQNGRFSPEFDHGRELILNAEHVIIAVGQTSDLTVYESEPDLKIKNGLIVVDESQVASIPDVYAGGDATSMPGSVIGAIAAGRRAASAIDRSFGGDGNIDQTLFERPAPDQYLGRIDGFAFLERESVPCLLPEARIGFAEIEAGLTREQAMAEASRCLQCDLRLSLEKVVPPPDKLISASLESAGLVPETEGVVILYDQDKKTLAIKGGLNMRAILEESLSSRDDAAFFEWEEDKMFSKRENELLQAYMQEHGEMPGGADDLDDLF